MIGRELAGMYPDRTSRPGDTAVLSVAGLCQPGILENVSLDVRDGEILGLFGLMGSGPQRARPHHLRPRPGRARHHHACTAATLADGPARRIGAGLAFVTENRREEGLLMDAPVADNLAMVSLAQLRPRARSASSTAPPSPTRPRRCAARSACRAGDIARQPVKALSGGNQQKVVIGKWLMGKPGLFILDEPTRGVDVGAKHEIYALADRLAASGSGILFISSELEELTGMCDRILVMSRGEIVGEFDRDRFETDRILASAFREELA